MSDQPTDQAPESLPAGGDLTEVFLAHAACGGEIDVVASEPGRMAVRCSGCGRTMEYALPGVAEAEASMAADPAVEPPAQPAAPAPVANTGPAAPAPLGASPEPAHSGAAAAPEPPGGPSGPEAHDGAGDVGDELDEEVPVAGLAGAVPVSIEDRPPRRRSWLRAALPALLGLAFLGAAILIAASLSDDDASSGDEVGVATETASPPGATGSGAGSAGTGQGGSQGAGKAGGGQGARDQSGGTGGATKNQERDKQGQGSGRSGRSDRSSGGIDLNFATVRGDIRVGLPRDWRQRGITSNGAIQYGPTDNTVAVQIFYERDAGRTSAEFAERARQFIRDRRPDARPKAPVVEGNEARIRSPYGSGLELARTVIDNGVHVMAIATIPNAAPPQRAAEAQAVIENVSGA